MGESLPHATRARKISLAIEKIKNQSGVRIDVHDLAKEVGMSRSHFTRQFKRATGCTPIQFALAARIESAKRRIESGGESLAAIAHLCGFASQPHLTRAFKACEGITPARYRALRQGLHATNHQRPDRPRVDPESQEPSGHGSSGAPDQRG